MRIRMTIKVRVWVANRARAAAHGAVDAVGYCVVLLSCVRAVAGIFRAGHEEKGFDGILFH